MTALVQITGLHKFYGAFHALRGIELEIAQGEVVVVNDKFGIRLTDIVTPSERLRRLSRG